MAEPATGRLGWRTLLIGAGGLGVLAIPSAMAAGAWVLSPAGFQRVLLPFASSQTGWTITASSGRVRLDGSVEVQDLGLDAPDLGLSLRADRLQARVDPMSLMGDLPWVHLAVLRGADLVVGPAPESEEEEAGETRVPVRIDRLAISDGTVRLSDGTVTTAVVDASLLTLKDLRPGASAALQIATNLAVAPGDPTSATDATLDLSGTLAQDEPGTTFTWTGKGIARVRPVVGPDPLRAETGFLLDTTGTAKTDDIAGTLSFAASRGPVALGSVKAEAAWKGGDAGSLTADATLEGLGPSFLNPLLALSSPVQMRAGKVDGRVHASTVGTEVTFESDLTGQDMSFAAAGGAATAPVRAHSAQSGAVAWDGSRVRLDVVGVEVDQGGRRVVTANLVEPLTLALSEGATQADAPVARLAIDLDRVALSDLRPWVALSGNDALADVSKGTLQAEVLAAVAEQGKSVRVTGSWEAQGVYTSSLGPLGIRHDLDVVIDDLARVTVAPRTASVAYDGRPLATLTPKVTYDSATGALDFDASVQADDGPETLRRLGALPESIGLRGGRLSGTVSFVRTGASAEPAARAKLAIGPSRLVDSAGSNRGTRSLGIELTAGFDTAWSEVRLASSKVTVDQGGTTGLVTAEGYWPLTTGAPRGGRLDVGLYDLEARPWAEMYGLVEPGAVKALPLKGDIVVIQEKGSEEIEIQGKETLGPFVPELGGGRQWTTTTVAIEHGGFLKGETLDRFSLGLTTTQPDKPDGRVDLAGKILLADRAVWTLDGTATRVDLSPFVVLELGPSEEAQSSVSVGGVDLGAYFDFAVPIDADIVVDLVDCSYFDLPIGQGKLILRGMGGNLRILLDAPKAAGGSANFAGKLIVTGRNPGFEWSLRAEDTDVGALVKAMNYGVPTWLRARGTFASEGNGRGVRTAIGRSLDGTFAFDLADGGFLDSALLDTVARETGVSGFERMGFQIARGTVRLEKGKLHLDGAEVYNVETKLAAAGILYDSQTQAWRVNPRIDEATLAKVAAKFNIPPIKGKDGFISLPIDITVGGTWAKPRYGVAPRQGLLEDAAGTALDALDQQTGLGLSGVAEDLFGIGGDEPAPAPAPAPDPAPTRPRPAPTGSDVGGPAPVLGKPGSTRPK